jgi:5-methylcytosine-specific restriction protein A
MPPPVARVLCVGGLRAINKRRESKRVEINRHFAASNYRTSSRGCCRRLNLMPLRPPLHRGAGFKRAADRRRELDRRRGSSRQRGYTTAWQDARAAYLAEHPLCVFCEREGFLTPATVVDHVEAHHGDHEKFWDTANWQSLCKRHHDSEKQRLEKTTSVEGGGWVKVYDFSIRTGALGKLLRPRNSTGGSND